MKTIRTVCSSKLFKWWVYDPIITFYQFLWHKIRWLDCSDRNTGWLTSANLTPTLFFLSSLVKYLSFKKSSQVPFKNLGHITHHCHREFELQCNVYLIRQTLHPPSLSFFQVARNFTCHQLYFCYPRYFDYVKPPMVCIKQGSLVKVGSLYSQSL